MQPLILTFTLALFPLESTCGLIYHSGFITISRIGENLSHDQDYKPIVAFRWSTPARIPLDRVICRLELALRKGLAKRRPPVKFHKCEPLGWMPSKYPDITNSAIVRSEGGDRSAAEIWNEKTSTRTSFRKIGRPLENVDLVTYINSFWVIFDQSLGRFYSPGWYRGQSAESSHDQTI